MLKMCLYRAQLFVVFDLDHPHYKDGSAGHIFYHEKVMHYDSNCVTKPYCDSVMTSYSKVCEFN